MDKSQEEISGIEPLWSANTTLLDLNDYCLSHICDFLDVFNWINLLEVSPRLQSIVECKYKRITKFEWINTEDCNSVSLHKVISLIGSQITCLTLDGLAKEFQDEDYCTFIHQKCGRVNSLMLKNTNNYVSVIGEYNFLPWLWGINLKCLLIQSSRFDSRFLEICTLKELYISYSDLCEAKCHILISNNRGIEILKVTHLQHVSTYICTLQILVELLVKLKMLHTLSIELKRSDVAQLTLLVDELQSLKQLTISCIIPFIYNDKRLIIDCEKMNINFFLEKLIDEEYLERLFVYGMFFNEITFTLLAILELKSLKLIFPVFATTIINIPMQLARTFKCIEHLKLILRDITITIEDIFLMVTSLPQLENLNLCNTRCSIEENCTLDDIFKKLNEILEKQDGRTIRLKLAMPLSSVNVFQKSNIPEFLLSPLLQLINPYYAINKHQAVIFCVKD